MACSISYTIVNPSTDGSGSGSFIVTGSKSSPSKQTTYTYTNLKCSRVLKTFSYSKGDFKYYDVDVTFTLNNNGINENYTFTGRYNTNDQKVYTTFIYSTGCSFTPTKDENIPSFFFQGFEGTITQTSITENKVNCNAGYGTKFILTQKAAGTSANLSATTLDGSSASNTGVSIGGQILCQAYVACLVQVETELNAATLVDAIGIGLGCYYYYSS